MRRGRVVSAVLASVPVLVMHAEAVDPTPGEGADHVDRTSRPGMLVEGSPQLAAFLDAGFEWGGVWRNPDPMHLQLP